jgi:hypothetical protein
VGSRALPLALVTAAFAAGTAGLAGLALWLGLLAVPAAAAAAFVSVSDALEGRPALLRALTSSFALALLVLGCAARSNAATGAATPRLAAWALLAALFSYSIPVVAWVLEPMRVTRPRPERRRRPLEAETETLSRAA